MSGEDALRVNAESFRLLFASNPQPMWVYDLHTLAFLEVNDAAVGQYGYTRDEFLRMRITDIRPAEDAARLRADVRQPRPALQYSGEWRHRRKDGRLIDVEIISHTLEFAGREAALVSAHDVTERKRAMDKSALLLARAQRDAARSRTLAALTAELAGAREPQTVLERAVDAAAELLDARSVAVFLLRPDGRGFDAAAARGLAPLEAGLPALSLEQSIAGRTVRGGVVQAVEDAAVERAAGTAFPRLPDDASVGAVLVAPIAEGGAAPLGVLEVYAAEPRAWPDEDRELLRALAAACAVALRGARETERARRDARRFRALAELSSTLFTADDPEAVLHRLVQGACDALQASRAVLIRASASNGAPTVTHEYNVSEIRPATELVDPAASRLWRLVTAQRERPQPIAIGDIKDHAELAPRWAAVAEEQRPRSILAAPLIDGGRAAGIVVVHQCGQTRRWEPEEIAFLQALAAQAVVALRQRRLFIATHEDGRRLAALNHIAEAMIGAPTFGVMCDRVLVALLEALEAGAGAIHVYDGTAVPERALRMVAWQGLSEQAASTWSALPLGHGAMGQAALRRAIVFAEDHEATPSEAAPIVPAAREEGLEARTCVPMLARGRLLGVLTVADRQRRPWGEADFSVLETAANQLAVALEAEELRSAAAATAAAREADRLKSELLGTVSHELRTPLGAIKGFASGLLAYGDRLTEAERRDSLRCIDDAADRLTELIDNLLALQRLEAGRLTVTYDTVDLVELADAVVNEMARQAHAHVLELSAPDGALYVRGDARRLRQVLQNLVDNAVKYSPDGGRVRLRLAACDGAVELRVEDEGVGIPPDQLPLIFERFHRVDSSMTRRIGGTGLGLAIVKGLVAAHGGVIEAFSAGEGHGSTFVVTLPGIQDGELTRGS